MTDDIVLLLARWLDLRERLALLGTVASATDERREAIEAEILEVQMRLAARFAKLPA